MKKYALCGASGRGFKMYAQNIVESYGDVAQLVGIFDINGMRANYVRDSVNPERTIPVFTDFDEMIKKTAPDVVIVATMDSSHHEYIVRSLDLGCDVICEKPMTIDAEKTREIFAAEQRNNRKIIVTFNARFSPYNTKIKEIMSSGAIGKVLSVDFEWLLDRIHGADYFRRWHKQLKNGGGLLITKATHHFDMVNWWIEEDPVKVYANGELSFYGPKREDRAERCKACPYYKTCDLAMSGFDDLTGASSDEYLNKMYFEPEAVDGYKRDQCVFAEDCDIWDNMSLAVRYTNNVLMSYSLNAYMPYEGWRIAINGTKGRLEASIVSRGPGQGEPMTIRLFYPNGGTVVYTVPRLEGMHGGSDNLLLNYLFRGMREDPLNHAAASRAGAMSLLIGAAANISIKNGDPVYIKDMVEF